MRDIDCDVWIALRNDWPPQPGYNMTSTWVIKIVLSILILIFKNKNYLNLKEWSFMTSNWTAFNSGEEQYNIPIQLTITKLIPLLNFYVTKY